MAPGELSEPLLPADESQAREFDAEESGHPANDAVNEQQGSSDDDEDDSAGFSMRAELGEMLQLGVPLAVSFFCRMGMASTDSAFVGHINDSKHTAETYLAAAVLSDLVVNVCITPPLAFNQVLNAMVGQAMGSGNPKMAGVWLQQSIFWMVVTMVPCLTGFFYVEPMLRLLGFPASVAAVAGTYARFNLLWPVPNSIYQAMRFYFQAQGHPRPAMYNNILFLFVNAFLNWIFVFGGPFKWSGFGFVGAAISLSVSRTLQPVLYYLYMFVYKKHHLPTFPDEGWSLQHHTWDRTKEFLKQSLPNIGTLLFQVMASQATTVLVGRLGEEAIAASSALQTVTIPWSGTISASCSTMSSVRVGYHLGRGNGNAAKKTAWLVMHMISVVVVVVALLFLPLQHFILQIATSDHHVLETSSTLVVAMLVGTYLNLLVSNITSGVFSGMGRPLIATILSFGFELPMSIGGVAIYILWFHGHLLGVFWWTAISGAVELVVVFYIFWLSDWDHWAVEARRRQEAREESENSSDENPVNNFTADEDVGSENLSEPLISSMAEQAEAEEDCDV